MQTSDAKLCYPIDALPALLHVSRTGVYSLVREGKLKARKIGRRTVILHADVEEFLAALPAAEMETA